MTMAKRKRPDPEEEARRRAEFEASQRELKAHIELRLAQRRERAERYERKRQRLNRWSLGLLGRA
jgi:hypothetical protein